MFNQQPFNRGKFNARSSQSMGNSATALMRLKSDILLVSQVISAVGTSSFSLKQDIKATKETNSNTTIDIKMSTKAIETLTFVLDVDSSIVLGSDITTTNEKRADSQTNISMMTLAYETLIFREDSQTNMTLNSDITPAIEKYGDSISKLYMNTDAKETLIFIVGSDTSSMTMSTDSNQSLSGEETITLENVNLKPNSEIVINTCDMTVMIDGQNAMKYFSSDSEFFSLLNGINEIVYSDDNTSRNISLDVIWKDRWL